MKQCFTGFHPFQIFQKINLVKQDMDWFSDCSDFEIELLFLFCGRPRNSHLNKTTIVYVNQTEFFLLSKFVLLLVLF